jgi:hypothetical protein
MPAIYEVEGQQYVVFCAAAPVKLYATPPEKIRGAYVAFSLPKTAAPAANTR